MPRIDNGTGRDISKWNGTLEKALIARKDMLNKCKTNNDLIDVLMDCEKDGLSMNGTDYTDKLIATISSNPNFHKNFQNVYNVILKGTGNGVLKCSAKKPAKGLKESVNVYDLLDADSDLVHTKHINDYIYKDNAIEIPDAPSKIEIAGHTIDYDEFEGAVVFDGVEAKSDDREELIGGETGVYYADTDNGTYTILFYYQRHGLLADVAVLEPELTKEVQYNLE